MSQAHAGRVYAVSIDSVGRWLARRAQLGSLAPTVQRHGRRPVKKDALAAWLPTRLEVAADATLAEHAAAFAQQEGLVASGATISRAIAALPPPGQDGLDRTPTGRVRGPGRPLKQRS